MIYHSNITAKPLAKSFEVGAPIPNRLKQIHLTKPVNFSEEALSTEDCLSAASSAGAKATELKLYGLRQSNLFQPIGYWKQQPQNPLTVGL